MKLRQILNEAGMNKTYSTEGFLSANKKITKLVTNYLDQKPLTREQWLNYEFDNLIKYVERNYSTDFLKWHSAVINIERKYKSFNLYLAYLIQSIKPEYNKS